VLILLLIGQPPETVQAAPLPGFEEFKVFEGLQQPTVIQFVGDGRVFVAEKSGIIKVFDNLTDTTPTIFADLNVNVYNFWDRGLLGMALDPNFPTNPYVYVLYAYDAAIGGTAPRWGTPGVLSARLNRGRSSASSAAMGLAKAHCSRSCPAFLIRRKVTLIFMAA
jgi:Glucose/sorbosone dehydrogenases